MSLEYSGISDVGKIREINQDSFGIFQNGEGGLFVVADGMGGYSDGEKASQKVIAELSNWWNHFSPSEYDYDFRRMIQAIEQTIQYANKCIYTEMNQMAICGTTVAALFIYKNAYGIIYAGDSRVYIRHKRRKGQLTVDEVWENQSTLSIQERANVNHPNRGKLTNAIGVREEVRCKILTDSLENNMRFLICSDGLYKYCSEKKILFALKRCKDKRSMDCEIEKLIGYVYENGANDNVTIITVLYKE